MAQATEETADEFDPASVDSPVVLFDGVCNLCHTGVQFVIEHDPDAVFKFASLQSDAGQALIDAYGPDEYDFDTFVLVEDGGHYEKSTAALRVARQLDFPWSLMGAFLVVPRVVRDAVYDFVARNRYHWFGKKDQCMVPDEDVSDRFLD